MKKLVNGKMVDLTPDEVTARQAEEAAATSPSVMYDKKEAEIILAFRAAVRASRSTYPQEEVDSFPEQAAELKAYDNDPLSETLLIDALALSRGSSKSQVVSRIRTQARAYKPVYGGILGKKQALLDDLYAININDADALTQIAAINW